MEPEWHSTPARDRIRKVIYRQGLPDRVPVEIGIGPWYACQLVGATTVDLMHDNPSPCEVMLEAYRRYQYDPWLWATAPIWLESEWRGQGREPQVERKVCCDTKDCYHVRFEVNTPYGCLTWQEHTEAGRPTVVIESPIKEPETDWPKYRYWMGEHREYRTEFSVDTRVAGKGVGGPGVSLPVHWWSSLRQGGIAAASYDFFDRPEFMDDIFRWYTERSLQELQAVLKAQPRELLDAYFIQGSSSSLSHSSLAFFKKYDLPFLKQVTRLTKQAGVPSHLHVCGRSLAIVELCYEETDLDIMEPLETPPGGDCQLGEIKRRFGDKLVLKGNLNTFQLLTRGSVGQVREATKRCLEEAMQGGGFWLATGDQTPADAPEENLLAVIETCKLYGRY